ncbi:CRM-domain containing factor CFM2, chloroplastic isoform X3 [Asparagus officinalis]|uniref:CRM-domain containing factor CFM2, chloroplastic isoform X3 n=1 Tax=Asparagus officinalis TaxID=4686 RepID=UPI00098E4B65|nr:CRM-domain containing factor CFM2, chloroplastic isoform X3 [Asparagus officinalis]
MLLSLPHPHPSLPLPSKTPKPLKPNIPRSSLSTRPETASTSAIQRISDKLRSLGYLPPNPNPNTNPNLTSAGEIFIPTPHELPKHRVGHTIDSSWSLPENPVPEPGTGIRRFRELWRMEKEEGRELRRKEKEEGNMPTVAELTIPAAELKRLRRVGIRLEKRLKVGKAGITEGIVNGIHERWRRSELVKIKCEDLCRMNMKRTHEILERKTGGLVVWRSGSIIILYRGPDYKYPYFSNEDPNMIDVAPTDQDKYPLSTSSPDSLGALPNNLPHSSLISGVGSPNKVRLQLPGEVQLEEETDQLLDGLGPRFDDWWGYDPLPVDADLLPAIVPGFRKPFRLLPFGVKPKLTDREMTILRRLSRPLPCHFALGRNRNLQGLAVSMIKLWEKCEVAKIAVKRGVQNTNSEIMVEELKKLTGGVLLSRDSEFIVFYRGKDFLPSAVSTAIEERRNSEVSRQKQVTHGSSMDATGIPLLKVARPASVDKLLNSTREIRPITIKSRQKPASLVIKRMETKLMQALEKKEKAEKLLATLEESVETSGVESDKETITKEERYMLRKVGLRMKPFLLLGRRGVFDGTVENMHLHWKYRELVKIISKDWSIERVESAARMLEAESGGILVAVERVNKGHAIIIYRGKNYRRPSDLRPKTLLNKKEAMKRSLEAQRCASLKLHVLSLSRNIDHLRDQMAKEQAVEDEMQLTESDKLDIDDERIEHSWSVERDHVSAGSSHEQQSTEEVNEAAEEYLHLNKSDCVLNEEESSTVTSNNAINSIFSLNHSQENWLALKHVDQFSKNENVRFDSESTTSTNMSNKEKGCSSNEPGFYPESSPRRGPNTCHQQWR